MHQADQIFALGAQLPALVRDAVAAPQVRLAVGISDGLPKLVVRQLLQPVLDTPRLRLLCHEDETDRLLADLALHRLDVVLADRAAVLVEGRERIVGSSAELLQDERVAALYLGRHTGKQAAVGRV